MPRDVAVTHRRPTCATTAVPTKKAASAAQMGAALSVVLGMMGPVQMGQNGGESPRPPLCTHDAV